MPSRMARRTAASSRVATASQRTGAGGWTRSLALVVARWRPPRSPSSISQALVANGAPSISCASAASRSHDDAPRAVRDSRPSPASWARRASSTSFWKNDDESIESMSTAAGLLHAGNGSVLGLPPASPSLALANALANAGCELPIDMQADAADVGGAANSVGHGDWKAKARPHSRPIFCSKICCGTRRCQIAASGARMEASSQAGDVTPCNC
mmetsp:Transcript_6639/g.17381  ORF Transcript_6639/g.17381 Transcript_6639/m.17381 type:complete len:213 (+) Transcript_6639:488-1126(+)